MLFSTTNATGSRRGSSSSESKDVVDKDCSVKDDVLQPLVDKGCSVKDQPQPLFEYTNRHKTVRVYSSEVVKEYTGDDTVARCADHEYQVTHLFSNHAHVVKLKGPLMYNDVIGVSQIHFQNHGLELTDVMNLEILNVAHKVHVVADVVVRFRSTCIAISSMRLAVTLLSSFV
ncbi:hypothetical protein SARC_01416 [Sphaeroforma arctica JP610]|uniref:Uncharacterized protein n=1 Tax=Sphaeroforma arctica JP610 TaxID=667725 RepID=A0A0L0GBT7_9EUKA|nr:hypothetical protein SARC_01416 [Sphaeroforma arctica JP610]KNC86460.1 hypothetical protein SARC_01416 [Sphaeroforma arctica JP610]|eukprot:XP_014160362.1 hypothetical protein SARC_01416 [Sphaeroforma arctica JP610]